MNRIKVTDLIKYLQLAKDQQMAVKCINGNLNCGFVVDVATDGMCVVLILEDPEEEG